MASENPFDKQAPASFTLSGSQRIVDATRFSEALRRNSRQGRGRYPVVSSSLGAAIALTGSSIPAMSGTTPGSGTVTLYTFNGTSLAAGSTVTAYNMSTTAVGASKYIQMKKIDGYWFVDVEAC